jgi:transposase
MRPYRAYAPEQAFLLPPSASEVLPADDPAYFLVQVVRSLDFEAFHRVYRCERGQPPYHPAMMVGIYFYGAMRGVYSSRKLADACRRDIGFMLLSGRSTPDYHTIGEFRQRFTNEIAGLFVQVLGWCQEAGLVRLGHISLDGTKLRANASKHKAMSYGRMLTKEEVLEAELRRLLEEGIRQDAEEDDEHGPGDDGWSLPEEGKVVAEKLAKIRAAKARLEEQARAKAVAEDRDPEQAEVPQRAQTNFTDPDSKIMKTPEGFQQCYNAQAAVDAQSQVIVAQEVSTAPPDVQRLQPMLAQVVALNGEAPQELSADAGYASEANFEALAEANITAYIALRRYHHDEPPDADPAPSRSSQRWPQRLAMRERLATSDGKARYKLRKQTVEPVFGQIKAARGFRQFLRRGLAAVQSEWAMLCTVHNLLKLQKAASQPA